MIFENVPSPVELNEEEYIYLSENLDVVGAYGKKEIVSFVSLSRKHMLCVLLKQAINNELSEMQKEIIRLLWYENLSVTKAAEILGVNKSTVTRQSQKAYDKLRNSLKYVMLYQFECPGEMINYFKEAINNEKRY